MKVICIKTFTYQKQLFIKNTKYELVEYYESKFFYVYNYNNDSYAVPTYQIDNTYKNHFITLKELRKLKLEKIDENR
jgi:hypothetical protein